MSSAGMYDDFGKGREHTADYVAKSQSDEAPSDEEYEFAHGQPRNQNFGIGKAINLLWEGYSVYRRGWNGLGQYIRLQHPHAGSKMSLPYLYISTVDDRLVPWLASQTDILATDWHVALTPAQAGCGDDVFGLDRDSRQWPPEVLEKFACDILKGEATDNEEVSTEEPINERAAEPEHRFDVIISFNRGQDEVVLHNVVDMVVDDVILTAFLDQDNERWTESYPMRTIYKVRRYD